MPARLMYVYTGIMDFQYRHIAASGATHLEQAKFGAARLGYRKLIAVCVLIFGSAMLVLAGTWYVRSWAAERRENVTYRQIAENNVAELRRRDRLLAESRGREREFRLRLDARRDAVAQIVERVEYVEVESACEIPEELWLLLEAGDP